MFAIASIQRSQGREGLVACTNGIGYAIDSDDANKNDLQVGRSALIEFVPDDQFCTIVPIEKVERVFRAYREGSVT